MEIFILICSMVYFLLALILCTTFKTHEVIEEEGIEVFKITFLLINYTITLAREVNK